MTHQQQTLEADCGPLCSFTSYAQCPSNLGNSLLRLYPHSVLFKLDNDLKYLFTFYLD